LLYSIKRANGWFNLRGKTQRSPQLLEPLINTHQIEPQQLLIGLEHTGIYHHPLLEAFSQSSYGLWLESGKQIRWAYKGVKRMLWRGSTSPLMPARMGGHLVFGSPKVSCLFNAKHLLLYQTASLASKISSAFR
jgi:hypothetical protein